MRWRARWRARCRLFRKEALPRSRRPSCPSRKSRKVSSTGIAVTIADQRKVPTMPIIAIAVGDAAAEHGRLVGCGGQRKRISASP
jgi:hypothetical protein